MSHRGEGGMKSAKKSVTYYLDGPLQRNLSLCGYVTWLNIRKKALASSSSALKVPGLEIISTARWPIDGSFRRTATKGPSPLVTMIAFL